MTFFVSGKPLTIWTKLTDNTATTCFTAEGKTTILGIACTEWGGDTPNLTIARVTPAPVTHYLRNALAMTAKQRVTIDEVFVLNKGDTIKVTSSDASGEVDVMVTYLPSDATVGGDHH